MADTINKNGRTFIAVSYTHRQPVEFCTIQIIGTLYCHALRFNTFLTLFDIIAVVTFILVDLLIVYFDNLGANTIKEVTVVSHHQDVYKRQNHP